MTRFDVFNGDADGICALQQLRLAQSVESELVTGVKRDIALLKKVSAGEGDLVTVLDVSLDKNREPMDSSVRHVLNPGGAMRVAVFEWLEPDRQRRPGYHSD